MKWQNKCKIDKFFPQEIISYQKEIGYEVCHFIKPQSDSSNVVAERNPKKKFPFETSIF
jgi:hypothetical protein